MFDILSIIEEATRESSSFENHAARALSLEERLLYLQGLSLVMNADGKIHEDEKEYIRILLKSFELEGSLLEGFVEFAQAPDKDTVQAFFRTFRRRPIAQLFLFDALMMTRRDGEGCEREMTVIDKIAEQLEVRKGTYRDIYDLFCHIKNKDWQESALYFSSHLLNPEHFIHLLDYYEVDFDQLLAETTALRHDRLLRHLTQSFAQNREQGKKRQFVLPSDVALPLLQSLLDRGDLSVVNDTMIFADGAELPIAELALSYNQEHKCLIANGARDYDNELLLAKFHEQFDVSGDILVELLGLKLDEDYQQPAYLEQESQFSFQPRCFDSEMILLFKGQFWFYQPVFYNLNGCDGFEVVLPETYEKGCKIHGSSHAWGFFERIEPSQINRYLKDA